MLTEQSRVALVCLCGPPHLDKTRAGMQILESWGLQPLASPILKSLLQGQKPVGYLAANDAERRADWEWARQNGDAIWLVRGGYGLTRILEQLPLEPERQLPVIGFSDATALLEALRQKGWNQLIHAPNIQTLNQLSSDCLKALQQLLLKGQTPVLYSSRSIGQGVEGILMGGNLCLLASLCGSAYQPQAQGAILALEDINEPAYRLDRMLTQMLVSRVFEGVRGIAAGHFSECPQAEEVLFERLSPLGVPILSGLPFGHQQPHLPLWLGQRVRLQDHQMLWTSNSTASGSGA